MFVRIVLLTRVIGRRELSTLEPFDLILLVVVGDLVQQGITQNDESVTGVIIVLSTIGLLTALVAYVSYRLPRSRSLLEGRPVVLVEDRPSAGAQRPARAVDGVRARGRGRACRKSPRSNR